MITAYGDAETMRKALEKGAEALLTKPIDFGTLRSERGVIVGHATKTAGGSAASPRPLRPVPAASAPSRDHGGGAKGSAVIVGKVTTAARPACLLDPSARSVT